MKNRLLRIVAILLLVCAVLPLTASAWESVDVTHPCSLALTYSKNEDVFPDQLIQVHRVAEIYADGSYALTEPFNTYPVNIQRIQSKEDWKKAADTLAAYIAADQIQPTAKHETDQNGNVMFSNLETGIYLVLGLNVKNDKGTYQFENFCVFLPTPVEDGTLDYDVSAKPKSSFTPKPQEPEQTEYKVTKLWKDSGVQSKRPTKVTVDILKDGTVQETVTLNSGNNWTYSWKAPADGATWTVVEKDVPDEYTVVITNSGTSFTITNSRSPSGGNTPPAKTGDTFPLRTWLLVMNVSGMLLIVLGLAAKRRRG